MTNGADRLAGLVAHCAATGASRQVLLLRTSRLPPALSRPHHLRLAEAALAPMLAAPRADMIHLPGHAVAVSWRGEAEAALLAAAGRLARLLEDGPPGTPTLPDLLCVYELPADGAALLQDCAAERPAAVHPPARPALDARALDGLEASLDQADVARFVRRQAVRDTASLVLAWEKRTLSVDELTASLSPAHDWHADPWLFRRLTRTLDRRMLALLASPGELDGAPPFSLDLNVASILGAEFLRFDAALPPALRDGVVIELTPADIMADPSAFVFARGFLRTRGYRLLLRCADPAVLPAFRTEAMEIDYIQIPWSEALADLPCPAPPERTVLVGADSALATGWARYQGIRLAGGRAMDALALGEAPGAA